MKYIASRLSEGNKIFPAQIHIEPTGIEVKIPGFFSGDNCFVSYEHISSVEIDTPMIGFSTITFFHAGNKVRAHGFNKADAKAIKAAVEEGKKRAKTSTVIHVNASQNSNSYEARDEEGTFRNVEHRTQSADKTSNFFTTAANLVGNAVSTSLSEARSVYKHALEEETNVKKRVEETASLNLSSDKEELLNQLNYLISVGNAKADKNLKKVIIEKVEFGVMKLKAMNALTEASFFGEKLTILKKKNPFDFLN